MAFVVGVPGVVAGEVALPLAAAAVLVAVSADDAEVPELAGWLVLPPVADAAAVLFMVRAAEIV